MATIREVAQRAGVSVGSVSRYINGKNLRPQTGDKIKSAINELGYQVDIFGKSLRDKRSYSVGVLVNDISNVFSGAICRYVEDGLERVGYMTMISKYRGSIPLLQKKARFLLSRHVDALVIIMSECAISDSHWLEKLDVPVVIVDNPILAERFPCAVVDNEYSVSTVCRQMFENDHDRIGLITPSDDTYVGRSRRAGWYDAYAANNRTPNSDDLMVGTYDIDSGYQAMSQLLDKNQVTAVFVASYYLTFGALKAIFERQLVVGRDIGFASFDDFGFSSIISPAITVVQQPVVQMAQYIIEALQTMIGTEHSNWPSGIKTFKSQIKYTHSIARKQ